MARFVALFALVLGVSGLTLEGTLDQQAKAAQDQMLAQTAKAMEGYQNALTKLGEKQLGTEVESFEKALEQLNRNLAAFEHKDLKDSTVFQEYVGVRDEAKKAAAALADARKALPAPAPTDWGHSTAQDEEEIEIAPAALLQIQKQFQKLQENPDTMKAQLVDMDFDDMESQEAQDFMDEWKQQKENEFLKSDKEENRMQEKLWAKKDKEMKLKLKNKQGPTKSKERILKEQAIAQNFTSPYRALSLKKSQRLLDPETVEEGKGTYGKFAKLILDTHEEAAETTNEEVWSAEEFVSTESEFLPKGFPNSHAGFHRCPGYKYKYHRQVHKCPPGSACKEHCAEETDPKMIEMMKQQDLKKEEKEEMAVAQKELDAELDESGDDEEQMNSDADSSAEGEDEELDFTEKVMEWFKNMQEENVAENVESQTEPSALIQTEKKTNKDTLTAKIYGQLMNQHPEFVNFFQKQTPAKPVPAARNLVQKGKVGPAALRNKPKKEEAKKEDPKRKILSLEATMKQREAELKEEAMIRQKATVEANKAMKLCNGVKKCEKMVDKKLEHGVFDHQVKEKLKEKLIAKKA